MNMISNIETDIKLLESKIKSSKSLSMKRYYLNDLENLMDLLGTLKLDHSFKVVVPEEVCDFSNKQFDTNLNNFFLRNNNNKDETLAIVMNSLMQYANVEYEILSTNYKCQTFNLKDTKDILCDFYTRYNPELYKWIKNIFDTQIILSKEQNDEYNGICYMTPTIKKNYIVLPNASEKMNVNQISYLAHELGHALNNKFLQTRLAQTNKVIHSNYLEVPSCTFEKMFLDFCSTQNIDKPYAELTINNLYSDTFDFLINLAVINNLKKVSVDDDLLLNVDEKEINEVFDKINEYIEIDNDNSPIEYRDSYIYGFGYLLSTHYSNMYKDNPKEARKQLENLICNIGIMDDYKILDNFSLNKDELSSGKQLFKSLNNNMKTLKKMNI